MKMLKVHQNAPTSILKSQNFSGGHTPVIKKREGLGRGLGRGREELGEVGKGGNRCLAHPKNSKKALLAVRRFNN
jgi:hypothetical protein